MKTITLDEQLRRLRAGRDRELHLALCGLAGCPAGGWGETEQALRRVREAAPLATQRADRWTTSQLIEAVLDLDHADRYRVREEVRS